MKFHRHSGVHAKDDGTSKRPIEITLPTTEHRNALLQKVRAAKRSRLLLPFPGSYVRRDLTESELGLEREVKRIAVRRNLEFGKLKWGVRDIELIEYKTPRDLPPNYATYASAGSMFPNVTNRRPAASTRQA